MENTNTIKVAKSRNRNLNPLVMFLFIVLAVYTFIFTFVLVWGFMTSLKTEYQFTQLKEYMQLPRYDLLPAHSDPKSPLYFPHPFYNYLKVVEKLPGTSQFRYYAGWNLNNLMPQEIYKNTIPAMLWNSISYALIGSIIIATVPCVAGYLCATYRYKFSSLCYTVTLFVMVMPITGTATARIRLLCRLNLFDTIHGDWIVNFTFANVYFLVFLAFYQGVSGTFAEAAEVDGASQLRTLVQIIMPLASKMIMTITLIFFIARWNNASNYLIYIPNKWSISYRIYQLTVVNTNVLPGNTAKIASCFIVALPMIILFIIFKDKMMGNLSMGGVKE